MFRIDPTTRFCRETDGQELRLALARPRKDFKKHLPLLGSNWAFRRIPFVCLARKVPAPGLQVPTVFEYDRRS